MIDEGALNAAVDRLIADPTEANLNAAKEAWYAARVPYQQSEVFRFGNTLVDDWEGQVNAWPLDEGMIDYVKSDGYQYELGNAGATANIIASTSINVGGEQLDVSTLTAELLADLNGFDAGNGERPVSDYQQGKECTNGNCDRRGQYLDAVTDLLVDDLEWMTAQWAEGAFAGDMGLTSSLKTATDCTPSQNCGDWANGGEPEVTDKIADFVTFYSKSLAVPARRDMDSATVQQGARLFNETGCAGCHTPTHVTGVDPQRPDLSNQTIWPYSDLLLHDMGPALADGRDEFLANGNEWHTAPLWDVGMAQQVNPLAGFLHDGRARTLEEAILWHSGEAQPASDRYRQMAEQQRHALVEFLNSL
ncbi:di-heme oxidoredictase family protein [Marinobacter gelidimuriae]|uniref:di-heme oxidoredictase family protein n=1 Tax=Marinobacter gelidimuriae TaxID=2739064 RepID=UPI00037899AF|nr:di-heme oxidoredictase family protein [Marinobacter gelidimuriae]